MQKVDTLVRTLSQNLDKLAPLLMVVKLGSVSRAAREVGLSQSALSHLISKFEGDVGIRCFERKAHGLEATADGKKLALFSQKVFAELRDLAASLGEQAAASQTRIRVGTHETLATHIWPHFIGHLKESSWAISLKSGRIDQLVADLLNEDLEVLFTVEPRQHSRIKIVPIYKSTLECYAGRQWSPNPKRKPPTSVSLEEIQNVPIFTDLEAHIRQNLTIPRALALNGLTDLGRFEMGSFEASMNLASMNLGLAFVPHRNARQALKEGRLRKLRIRDLKSPENLEVDICLSYLEKSSRAEVCAHLAGEMKKFLG
jgi:DNA-binding transcriptional LysR family regulator